MSKNKRIVVYGPGKDYDIVRSMQVAKGSSVSALFRKLMRDYLQQNKGVINIPNKDGEKKVKTN
jgi:hypothetical protein